MTQQNIVFAGFGRLGQAFSQLNTEHNNEISLYGINRSGESKSQVKLIQADLLQPHTLDTLPPADILIYTATPDQRTTEAYRAAYVDGLDNLLQAYQLQHCQPQLIYISSTRVYSQQHGEWVNESSYAYARDGLAQALLTGEWLAMAKVPGAIILRLSGLYDENSRLFKHKNQAGNVTVNPYDAWTNRIHRYDAARILWWLRAKIQQQENCSGIWLGSDLTPCRKSQLQHALIAKSPSTTTITQHIAGLPQGKRCWPQRLLNSGFQWQYPSYKEGYCLS